MMTSNQPDPLNTHGAKRNSSVLSTRRGFLQTASIAATAAAFPALTSASVRQLEKPITIGLIADLHHDVMHDGETRVDAFLQEMAETKPDAIMQLGDFAYPNAKNKAVTDKFNAAHDAALHVIGNHDTDSGHTMQQCVDIWGMSGRYYRHDVGGLRLLVLDGNDKGSPDHKGGYPSYIGKEQVEWLGEQLAERNGPIVVVSHQPLAGYAAVDNAKPLQELLGRHAEKVVLVINGHTHIDATMNIAKVPYLHVNSASYKWVGGGHKHESYPKEIHARYRWVQYTCPYRESLFTTLTFDPKAGTISVKGKMSEWVGPSPKKLGINRWPGLTHGKEITPQIRARQIELM